MHLLAAWRRISTSTYKITIADGIEHGTVTADKVCADKGDTVTLTVAPETGCVLTDLTVTYTDGEGAAQTITPAQDGTDKAKYTFTMPEANVQVSATFGQTRQIFIQWSGKSHSSIGLISGFMGEEGNYSAIEGNTVTFRVTPDSGYGMSSVSATEDYGENVVTVTDLGEGKFSFVMPDYNINLYAECIAVHVDIPTGHGTVTVEPEHPKADNTVTLTVSPDSGYALGTLAVTKDDTYPVETVEITATETEGEYTFTMPAANVTVNATFNANTYTVSFDMNAEDATGAMEPMQLTYDGDWATLTANTFTRTGYGFSGWNTEADGSGTAYSDEDWVKNLTTEANIVLYAQWGKDIADCAATVPDQTKGDYSYIFYKFEAANSDAELAAQMGVTVKDGDTTLILGTDYEFGNVKYADERDDMPANVGDNCLLEIKGKGAYAGNLWAPFTITVNDDGGQWGDNLTWAFHAGTLTITGNGVMQETDGEYPWQKVSSYIHEIIIGEGVTSIASGAFAGNSDVNYYSSVTAVILASTVTTIGANAFAFMTALESIDLTHVTNIGANAFNQCTSLTATVPDTVTTMADGAFEGCNSVTYAVVPGSTEHGSVTANVPSAKEDDTVTLTITPAADYTLDTLTVTTLAGTSVTVTDNQFTMPKANVTVSATFKHLPVVTFDSDGGSAVEAQTIAEGGKAKKPVDPTKDNARFIGWYQVMDDQGNLTDTPFDFENTTIEADITLKAKWAAPVTLTVAMQDTNGAAVSGSVTLPEGDVYPGDEVTLIAPRVSGYNFTGWFAEGGTQNLCRDLGYTFTVGDVIAFVARYEALPTVSITINGGDAFTVNGSSKSGQVIMTFTKGTTITVTSNAETFDYWVNQYGSTVSTEKTYRFTATNSETVSAVFRNVVADKATLVFKSITNQIMGRDQLAVGETMTLPTLPNRNGYDTLGWDLNGDGTYDSGDILETAIEMGLKRDDQTLIIYPVYKLRDATYSITVVGGSGSGEYKQNAQVTVTADAAPEGKRFSHWMDESGHVLKYEPTYKFTAERDRTLTAVFVDEAETVVAVGTTAIINTFKNESNHTLSFVSMSSVPDGCVIEKAGIISTNVQSVGESGDGFNAESAMYVRGYATEDKDYRYTWNKSKVNSGDTWYVRAYLVYTDANGNTHTVYGEMVSQTF